MTEISIQDLRDELTELTNTLYNGGSSLKNEVELEKRVINALSYSNSELTNLSSIESLENTAETLRFIELMLIKMLDHESASVGFKTINYIKSFSLFHTPDDPIVFSRIVYNFCRTHKVYNIKKVALRENPFLDRVELHVDSHRPVEVTLEDFIL